MIKRWFQRWNVKRRVTPINVGGLLLFTVAMDVATVSFLLGDYSIWLKALLAALFGALIFL